MTDKKIGHRESAEVYTNEICRAVTKEGSFRVILCRGKIQWIIQRLTSAHGTAAGGRWHPIAYLRTSEALLRLWQAHTGGSPTEILSLPSYIRVGTGRESGGND